MAAINFPSPATQGDTYSQNGLTWTYNGEAWVSVTPSPPIDDTAYGVGWNGDTTTAASKNALYD